VDFVGANVMLHDPTAAAAGIEVSSEWAEVSCERPT
jgi:hypothetical protein